MKTDREAFNHCGGDPSPRRRTTSVCSMNHNDATVNTTITPTTSFFSPRPSSSFRSPRHDPCLPRVSTAAERRGQARPTDRPTVVFQRRRFLKLITDNNRTARSDRIHATRRRRQSLFKVARGIVKKNNVVTKSTPRSLHESAVTASKRKSQRERQKDSKREVSFMSKLLSTLQRQVWFIPLADERGVC